MSAAVSRVYPLLAMIGGYLLLILSSPVRIALRDGLRCLFRFQRLWQLFALFAFAYSIFQFLVFSPGISAADFELHQFVWRSWHWPLFPEIWRESALHALESVAGIFDAATTTYPLSVVAALLLLANWRGLHFAFFKALHQRFGITGWLIYLAVLLSALASLFKPLIYWLQPDRARFLTPAHFLQASAAIDSVAFIFEYLCAVYLQVYLIAVAFAWVKGFNFREGELLRFGVRRFSFVLRWVGVVVLASTLLLRVPLLVAYFRDVPGVLDYLPVGRCAIALLVLSFATMQISLVLHNETLGEAFRAHFQFLRRHPVRFGWFVLICGVNFWFLCLSDTTMRAAATGRVLVLILWKLLYILLHALVTGWLLASWVSLYRQCEVGRVNRETWIRY
jgi:hypothetical protein